MYRLSLRFRLSILSVILFVGVSSAQNITTIAGNRSAGFSGDGGNATSASLNSPSSVTVSSTGDYYIADQANNRVRKVSAAGIITTIAGTGTAGNTGDGGAATAATLNGPMSVAVDAAGNVYIADYNNARIRKVSTSGVISNVIGTGSAGYSVNGSAASTASIAKPTGVTVDGSGNIYVAEQNNHIIRKINSSGIISTVAGNNSASFSGDGGNATAAGLSYPYGMLVDASGNIYIIDAGNNRIRKVTASGIITTVAGNGSSGFSGDGGAATAASINNPSGLAIDGSGNLLIGDLNNQRIRQVTAAGIISTIAGTGTAGYSGDGGSATACTFYKPSGLAVYAGKTYIADMGNSAIRQITTASHTPAFTGGAAQALGLCTSASATAINALMAISDIDAGQTETWTVILSPAHGTLAGFPKTATSTGGIVTPSGLTYTPTTSYSGTDSFKIQISDGALSSITTILVTTTAAPSAGTISGASAICAGTTSTYTNTVSGGAWTSGSAGIATISSAGVVTGVTAGAATLSYTVTNPCASATTIKIITVNPRANAGTITGATSLYVGGSTTLADTSGGSSGTWSSGNTSVATISSIGGLGAIAAGTATISYAVTNTCGTVYATSVITVTAASTTGSGTISRYAGNYSNSYSVDGGSATAAAVNHPGGIAMDGSGNLYIADQANNRVRKVSTAGIISTIAGNGGTGYAGDGGAATACNMNGPFAVAVDSARNVYVADYSNNRVRVVNASGIISTFFGGGGYGAADGYLATSVSISHPSGVAADLFGNVYVTDQNAQKVWRIDNTGHMYTAAGTFTSGFSGDGGPASAANVSYPTALAVDASGNVYFVDGANERIRKITRAGIISTVAGNGSAGSSGDGGQATAAALNNPSGLAIDASGNLILTDQNNQTIRQISTAGIITTIAGTGSIGSSGDGGPATAATFYNPMGVAAYAGNIYVADMGNNTVRQISPGTTSHTPTFTGGTTQSLSVCTGASATSINALLAITDLDAGQTETWTVVSSPAHGTLAGFPRTATSTGGVVTPASLTYAPATAYSGSDTFRIKISDGTYSSTTLIMVTVNPATTAGTISGPSSFCPNAWTTFSNSVSGGVWSSSMPTIATITSAGAVYGTGAGSFVISYTVTNSCGTAVATKADTVTSIPSLPNITGASSVGVGSTITLADATPSGSWSSSNTAIATVSAAGVVTGVSTGYVSITYTVSNPCSPVFSVQYLTVGTIYNPNIYTFAGDGTGASGYSGDGPNAGRLISGPAGVASDANGYIYFSERGNNVIRKVKKVNGYLYTVAGNHAAGFSGDGGQATAAALNTPAGIAVDKNGNVYIADQGNARIRKVNTSNVITTICGTGTIGYTADGGAASTANIAQPMSVAVDTAGNIYFAEQNNHRIRKISTSGILTTVAGNGSASFGGDGAAATAASISYPAGVWIDAARNIYIADAGNNRIRKVTSAGIISTIAGNGTSGYSGDGGAATAAKLANPYGVATDSLGNVYIADRNNNTVRKVTPTGTITTVAGNGTAGFYGDRTPATSAHLYYPEAVLCDSSNLYIADFSNNAVRVVGHVTYQYDSPVPLNSNINLSVCKNASAFRMDTLMGITDDNYGTTDAWYTRLRPAHGTLTGFPYTHASTGGFLQPSGLFYTPTTGYSGPDTFMITVANYGDSSYIYVFVNVTAPGTVPAISGASTVNIGYPVLLSDSVSGGAWSSSNTAIASITNAGILIGVTTGSATITYTLTTGCGTSSVTKAITVGNTVPHPSIYSFAGNGKQGYMNPMYWYPPTGSLWGPAGMARDNSGNFYFSEQYNQDVDYITYDAYTFYRELGPGSGFTPTGVAVDKYNNKFVADYGNSKIIKIGASGSGVFAGTGTSGFTADGAMATAANIGQPQSIAVDTAGNLYFVEGAYNRVRKVSAATGILTTVAGNGTASFSGDGGQATAATLSGPTSVWADDYGNVFIADAGNNRVRKVASSGIISTVAGNGSAGFGGDGSAATAATLNNPFGVTTDSVGDVFIADRNNNRVRKVSITGIISTIAGTGTAGYTGDDGPATAAQLSGPQSVLCSGNDLYILDFGNNTIRVVGSIYYPHSAPTALGSSFSPTVCRNGTYNLDSLSSVTNADLNITDTWRQTIAPVHGTLSGFPDTATPYLHTLISPAGLIYTPTSGYTGTDSFTIMVTDGYAHATITFYPNVITAPAVAAIAGSATVAISTPIALTDATAGGVWRSTNTARATVTAGGVVKGVTAGADTIMYTVTNTCGATAAIKSITVTAGRNDNSALPDSTLPEVAAIRIYPNPTTSTLNIELPQDAGNSSYSLIDINGKIVRQMERAESHVQLNLSDLPRGNYILVVSSGKGVSKYHVVIDGF